MEKDPFKEYILESDPTKKELGYSWYTAIGLQRVDGLETSEYLKSVALSNIDGDISLKKAEELNSKMSSKIQFDYTEYKPRLEPRKPVRRSLSDIEEDL